MLWSSSTPSSRLHRGGRARPQRSRLGGGGSHSPGVALHSGSGGMCCIFKPKWYTYEAGFWGGRLARKLLRVLRFSGSSFPGFGGPHCRHGCSGLRKLVRLAVSRGPAERSVRVWRWRQAVVVRRRRSRTISSRGKKSDLTDWRSSRIPTSGDSRTPLEGSSGPNFSRNSGGLSPRS